MKIVRFIAAIAMLTAAVVCVSAQQRPTTTPAAPTAAPQGTVAIPDSKVAIIYSDMFLDEKTGIARFHTLLGTLNREFEPRRAELQALQTRINTLAKEIDDTQNVAAPDSIRQKRDQLAQLNTEFKRKGEDAETAYNKRRQDIFSPLQQDITKALDAFAKARGITMILDGSQVPGLYPSDTNIDITRAFITEFNSRNPATASVTTP